MQQLVILSLPVGIDKLLLQLATLALSHYWLLLDCFSLLSGQLYLLNASRYRLALKVKGHFFNTLLPDTASNLPLSPRKSIIPLGSHLLLAKDHIVVIHKDPLDLVLVLLTYFITDDDCI